MSSKCRDTRPMRYGSQVGEWSQSSHLVSMRRHLEMKFALPLPSQDRYVVTMVYEKDANSAVSQKVVRKPVHFIYGGGNHIHLESS